MACAEKYIKNSICNLEGKTVFLNLPVPTLIQHALKNDEAVLANNGAVVANTGKYTGRTPKDKFVVISSTIEDHIWRENNALMSKETFDHLKKKAEAALADKTLYVTDAYGGANPKYRINVRFIGEKAWHALFFKQLLIRPSKEELDNFEPEWTIIDLCEEKCDPAVDGTNGEAVIALNFDEKLVLIMGTQYAGETKKSVFTILNALLPLQGVLSMHCSANQGDNGDAALFFGLSGTGKTTLSADPHRHLIGDDEHGWCDTGIFNIEGGCYAKCINLSRENEPEIWNAIKFGSVLENVILDENGTPDYTDKSRTENTRVAYPLEHIENARHPSMGNHPKNIIFLTCDAFGVLPPVSKLTPEQAMEQFLMGYTAKVAGTESGITEPQATFSTCFGSPFLPLKPKAYATLLKKKIEQHNCNVWLVNTGWTSGSYGKGHRIHLKDTRGIIDSILDGSLENEEFVKEDVFNLFIPTKCNGVDTKILNPRNTWESKDEYDTKALELKEMFINNVKKHR